MVKINYYSILGVERTAMAADIKKAYRTQAGQHHPDKGGDAAVFQQVNEAYEVLGDVEKRAKYDATLPTIPRIKHIPVPAAPVEQNETTSHRPTWMYGEQAETREEELKRIFDDPDYAQHHYFTPRYRKSETHERAKRARAKRCRICHGRGMVSYNVRPEMGAIGIEERLCICQIVKD